MLGLAPSKPCERLLPNMAGGVSVFAVMKTARFISYLAPCLLGGTLLFAVMPASAQLVIPRGDPENPIPLEAPEELRPHTPPQAASPSSKDDDALTGVLNTAPDYSELTPKAEREVRLDALFERLKAESDADAAKLIAEEIWALWLDSGSPSINMILLRGTAFEKQNKPELARRMYDHVTTLMPDYAEGWARSARLAYTQSDYNRALVESTQALILEPREFYALWTLGNVLEKLGRNKEAFETYREALGLYPEHPSIKARVETMQSQIDGDVL